MQKILHSTPTHTLIATATGSKYTLSVWNEETGEKISKATYHLTGNKSELPKVIEDLKKEVDNLK